MFRRLLVPVSAFIAVAAISVVTTSATAALTTSEADVMMNAYNAAFFVDNGTSGYYRDKTDATAATWFWGQAEEIEMLIDAYERTGNPAYYSMISKLCNGFTSKNGTSWTWNKFNDDIMWAVIAFSRAYLKTGNVNFRTYAKNNFDDCFARAWDSDGGGGLWWTTDKTSKNSCVNFPAAIGSYHLYLALGDSYYLTKCNDLFTWGKANLWNPSTGKVYDSVTSTVPTTYNQGTFIGTAHFLNDVASATKAANYTRDSMGTLNADGYRMFVTYDPDSDGGGFNGIFARWMARFMVERGLQSTYAPWLQANAQNGWNRRRTSDNLSWCKPWDNTPEGVLDSWGCTSTVMAAQVFTIPSAPAGLRATLASGTATLNWTAPPTHITGYQVKRSTTTGGPYTTIATNVTGTTFQDTGLASGEIYYYVVSATNDIGQGANSVELIVSDSDVYKLTGTIIGTAGAWNGGTVNTKEKVYDGLLNTFFDAPQANGAWAGIDLGSGNETVVTSIRYSPRNSSTNWLGRMVGGQFQGADNPAFDNAVTLYTVTDVPAFDVYTIVPVTNSTPFRYLRYLSPNGGYCNVSEVKFIGPTFDLYAQWLQQQGWTPGTSGSGFSEDADGNGLNNAAEYVIPMGLSLSRSGTNDIVTSLVRQDPQVTVSLLTSTDLTAWSVVSFPVASDQTAVPAGFQRRQLINAISPSQTRLFYRLQLTR